MTGVKSSIKANNPIFKKENTHQKQKRKGRKFKTIHSNKEKPEYYTHALQHETGICNTDIKTPHQPRQTTIRRPSTNLRPAQGMQTAEPRDGP